MSTTHHWMQPVRCAHQSLRRSSALESEQVILVPRGLRGTGHWLVGYLAHNRGGRTWHIEVAAVQGFNVPTFALLTMGESWVAYTPAFRSLMNTSASRIEVSISVISRVISASSVRCVAPSEETAAALRLCFR